MTRTLALVALVALLAGCSRYGTRANGPFANRIRPNPNPQAVIPPGPPATSSPLVLGSDLQPQPPLPPGENRIVPTRPGLGEPGGDDLAPAGGLPPEDANLFPPLRRRPEVKPGDLPSPFAPKSPATEMPRPGDPVTPAPPPAVAASHIAEVKKLAADAAAKWAKVDTYEAIVSRRELAPNKEMCEDVVLYQFRKEPLAVYIRNVGESGKGREIVYYPSKHEDKIHIILGDGDGPKIMKGFRPPPQSPDSAMVKEKSRYSIREAGMGTPINRVANWAAKAESGKIPAENLTYLGQVTRKEYPYPLTGVQLNLRPGDDPLLPKGGMRQWFFDTKADSLSNGFPVLIIATEPSGKEVEYYLMEKVKTNIPLTDADFSPDRLVKKK